MRFIELLPAFKSGQKLRRTKEWEVDEFCGLDEEGMYWQTGHDNDKKGSCTINWSIEIEDLEADDWDFYFPPLELQRNE